MGAAGTQQISGLDLTGNEYRVEQSLIRSKYKAMDSAGNTILRGKQKMFKMKEEFPFKDPQGNEVLRVKASGIVDVAGDYVLSDARTDEELIILDNDFSILQDVWKIRDAATEAKLAEITSRGAAVMLARHYIPFGALIPHKYEITDAAGNHVGNINGQLSFRDKYDITIDDASNVPKESIVAAAMVIDAIQNN
jgi:uncharacterized protein YxjI